MSRTRRLSLAAYKRLIESLPETQVNALDDRLTPYKGRRADAKDAKQAGLWAMGVRTPSKWYATDGTQSFYYFRRRKVDVDLVGYVGIGRLATTVYGTSAAQAYYRHDGQITDRRPRGWLSAATIKAVNFGGLDGQPSDWGWPDNEDLDLDMVEVEKLRGLDGTGMVPNRRYDTRPGH